MVQSMHGEYPAFCPLVLQQAACACARARACVRACILVETRRGGLAWAHHLDICGETGPWRDQVTATRAQAEATAWAK
jgi:hypothetical protein